MASMNCMTLVHQPQRWFMPSLGARSTNRIIQVDKNMLLTAWSILRDEL